VVAQVNAGVRRICQPPGQDASAPLEALLGGKLMLHGGFHLGELLDHRSGDLEKLAEDAR